MKKILYMMAAAIGLAGCAQEDILVDNESSTTPEESNAITSTSLTAVLSPKTRVDIEGFDLKWSENDKFVVFNEDWSAQDAYKLDAASAGQPSGIFNLDNKEGAAQKVKVAKYAVYPFTSEPAQNASESNKIDLILPETYNLSKSPAVRLQNAPMLGEVGPDNKVVFNQFLTALLKIDCGYFPEGFTELRLASSNNNQSLSGKSFFDKTEKVLVALAESRDRVDVIDVDRTQPVYLPIPAQKYDKLTVYAAKRGTGGAKDELIVVSEIHNMTFEKGLMYNVKAGGLVGPVVDMKKDGWMATGDNAKSCTVNEDASTYWGKTFTIVNTVKSWYAAVGTYKSATSMADMTALKVNLKAKVPTLEYRDSKNNPKRIGIAVRTANGTKSFGQGNIQENKNEPGTKKQASYGTQEIKVAGKWQDISKTIDILHVLETSGNGSGSEPKLSTAEDLSGFKLEIFANEPPYTIEVADVIVVSVYGNMK